MTPENLIAWRKHLGLNKTAAAKALGLSINAYLAYEKGEYRGVPRPIPKYVALAAVTVAAGLSEYANETDLIDWKWLILR